jgi:hypothetical protein
MKGRGVGATTSRDSLHRRRVSLTIRVVGFEVVGPITNIEIIATGRQIRTLRTLRKRHGKGRWRKLKGTAQVRLNGGERRLAEVHWYEAHGIGRRGLKIKRFLD